MAWDTTGEKLTKTMDRTNTTIQMLADHLGLSWYTVSSWRQGRRVPCCRHMEKAVMEFLKSRPRAKRRFRRPA